MSITKSCETLNKQTSRGAEETLDFKLTKSRDTFFFKSAVSIDGSWMLWLTSLEFYISVFNITEHKIKFELYTATFDEFSFEELKDEVEEVLITSDILSSHLQHEIVGPRITQTYKKLGAEKSSIDDFIIILMGYARSEFRDVESYLRIVGGLDEGYIKLILKRFISNFVTSKTTPGIYSNKYISQAVDTMGDHEGTLKIENNVISLKAKLILTRWNFWNVTI